MLKTNRTARQRPVEVQTHGTFSDGAVWQSESQECRSLGATLLVATCQQILKDKLPDVCPGRRRTG